MSDVNAQDVVVGEDDDHSNLIKAPQHETAVSPCINRTKPAVKIEVTGIQLDVEHAWENGYKAGAPGFFDEAWHGDFWQWCDIASNDGGNSWLEILCNDGRSQ